MNKVIKRLLACFILVMSLFGMSMSAMAEETHHMTSNGTWAYVFTYNGTWHNTIEKKFANSSKAAFCGYYDGHFVYGTYVDLEYAGENLHEALAYVLANGVQNIGHKSVNSTYSLNDADKDYAITQLATWGVMYELCNNNDFLGMKLENVAVEPGYDGACITKAKALRDAALSFARNNTGRERLFGTNPTITLKSPNSIYLTKQSDGSYKSGKYTFKLNDDAEGHVKELTVSLSNAPAGASIEWVKSSDHTKGFYVTMTKAGYDALANNVSNPQEFTWDITGSAKFKGATAIKLFNGTPSAQYLVYLKWKEMPTPASLSAQAKIKVQPDRRKGNLYIWKKTPAERDLPQTTFSVYGYNSGTGNYDVYAGKMTWNGDKHWFQITNLPCYDKSSDPYINNGMYEVREEASQAGCINEHWSRRFQIVKTGAVNQYFTVDTSKNIVSIASEPPSAGVLINTENQVTISKVNEDDTLLKEAVFEYGMNTSGGTRVTTTNGVATLTALAPGTWYYREVDVTGPAATAGYKPNNKWHSIGIDADGYIISYDGANITKTTSASFKETNYITQPLAVTKKDKSNVDLSAEEYLKWWAGGHERSNFPKGTTFGVYEYDATAGSYKTTPYATLVWDNFTEMFVNQGTGQKCLLQRRMKQSAQYGNPNSGKFLVKELTATPGFMIDKRTVEITVPANPTSDATAEFVNEPNRIQILKRDGNTGELLSEAKFDIWYGSTKGEDYFEIVTGRDNTGYFGESSYNPASPDDGSVASDGEHGMAYFTHLKPGTWHIQETDAPDGYAIDKTVYDITVTQDGLIGGQALQTLMVDDGRMVKVKLVKKDSETGDIYSLTSNHGFPVGTEFDVYEWDETNGAYSDEPVSHIVYKE